jgi:luciferase family oxidoreductase group 1
MLPNHAPLVVAEAFGTLAELYPGRIDLGLGRAPAPTPPPCARCAAPGGDRDDFPRDVAELQRLLGPVQPGQRLVAMPGAGTNVPIWLLGSSLFSAQLAAQEGCPTPLPRTLRRACCTRPSTCTAACSSHRPHAASRTWPSACLIAAPTDDEAEYLASSTYQRVLSILTGNRLACSHRSRTTLPACNRRSARPLATFWPPP